jgi:hypothetical protein
MIGKILFVGFWVVVVFWVINNPHTAAQDVHNVGTFISSALPHGG